MSDTVNIIPPAAMPVTINLTAGTAAVLSVTGNPAAATANITPPAAMPAVINLTPPAAVTVVIAEAAAGSPGINGTGLPWVSLTMAAYNALSPPATGTIYDITDAPWSS